MNIDKNTENSIIDIISNNIDNLSIKPVTLNSDSTLDYSRFVNFLLSKDNTTINFNNTISTKDLNKDNFLEKFKIAFALAIYNEQSPDLLANKRADAIRTTINYGYLNNDIKHISLDIPSKKNSKKMNSILSF